MPPRKKRADTTTSVSSTSTSAIFLSLGAGMTAGLELWRVGDQFALVDKSTDGRFAVDVALWNGVIVGLNEAALSIPKDAKK